MAKYDGGLGADSAPATLVAGAPTGTTGLATNITSTSAILNGVINPNGTLTAAKFEYGATSAYGTAAQVTLTPNNGSVNQEVSTQITGLVPNTTYHFHVTAKNSKGTLAGTDATFTTLISTPPTQIVLSWGYNETGAVGDGTRVNRSLPVDITNKGALAGKTITEIVSGYSHALARCSDGTLISWGENIFGELGDGTKTNRPLPVNITGKGALAGKTVVKLASGAYRSYALCSDGTLATWGYNQDGRLNDANTLDQLLPLDITNKGALNGKRVSQIASGDSNTLVLCTDGTLVSWGFNQYGALGTGDAQSRALPTNITGNGALQGKKIQQIMVGGSHSMALCTDGTLASWGFNKFGMVGDGTTTDRFLPIDITNQGALKGKTITQLQAGQYNTVALCSDGTIAVWGDGGFGELGTGLGGSSPVPISINDQGALQGKTVTQLKFGAYHSLALCSDGTVTTWGRNLEGQVGDGTTTHRFLPVDITDKGALKGVTVTQLTPGYYFNVALATPGRTPVNQPPTVTILTPTPKQSLSLSDFNGNTISGSATDDAGVTKLEIKLLRLRDGVLQIWDGTSFTTLSRTVPAETSGTGPSINWKLGQNAPPTSQLDAGEYQVIVYATDAQGLTATAKTNFTLTAPVPTGDTQKPVVTINTPTSNQTLKLTDFVAGTLSGNATDNVGVTSVTVKLYRTRNGVNQIWNGTAFTTLSRSVPAQVGGAGTNINWSLGEKVPPPSLLDAGEYQFIVYATDAAGNIGQTRSTFTLEVPASPTDTERPVVSISAPTVGQNLLTSSIVAGFIRGRASDNVGVLKVDLKLYRSRGGVNQVWNGTSFSTTVATVPAELSGPTTDTAWSLGAKTPPQNLLDAGEYQLIAYVTDAAGNTSAARTTFTLAVSGTGS